MLLSFTLENNLKDLKNIDNIIFISLSSSVKKRLGTG